MANWQEGPDKIMPAEGYTSISLEKPVKLKSKSGEEKLLPIKPQSLYSIFKKTVTRAPTHTALVSYENDQEKKVTFEQYWKICHDTAKSLIYLGLKPRSTVSAMGFNSPQWMYTIYGTIFAGGVINGIYTTNSPDACEFVLTDSGTEIVVVENKIYLDRIMKGIKNTNVKYIILYGEAVQNTYNGLVKSWDEFIQQGLNISDDVLNERLRGIAPNKCAALIYTSGTTGNPKGAMISHDNIYYETEYFIKVYEMKLDQERIVSYLPMSHIAGQMLDCYVPVNIGATVYFAEPDALKGSLTKTLQKAKPTLFFGVPRVWEKIQESLTILLKNNLKIASVKQALGLAESKHFLSGSAPITLNTLKFFKKLNINICEAYGMSECCGAQTIGNQMTNKLTSVGSTFNGYNKTFLFEKDDKGNGEICMFGRNVFMGYLNNEEKTREALDSDGWLHSGDIGKIDENGFLFITGRLKELVIGAGGENIAPVPIEDNIKAELPQLISNVILIGDKRKYLIVLVSLQSKLNPMTTASLDELKDECIQWLKSNNCNATKVSEIIEKKEPFVFDAIDKAIKKANNKAISRAANVQKFAILPRDFSVATGELGPTLKLKRHIVHKMYNDLIDSVYNEV